MPRLLFCNALAAGLLLSSFVVARAEDEKVGHPYVPDKGMMDMGPKHPISAYEAKRRLEAEGHKLSGPLELKGKEWEAKSSDGTTLRLDLLSGNISK
jgi:hypothetical protein